MFFCRSVVRVQIPVWLNLFVVLDRSELIFRQDRKTRHPWTPDKRNLSIGQEQVIHSVESFESSE